MTRQYPDWIVHADDPTAALLDAMPDTWQVMTKEQYTMLTDWQSWIEALNHGTAPYLLPTHPKDMTVAWIRINGPPCWFVRRIAGGAPYQTIDTILVAAMTEGGPDATPEQVAGVLERLTQQWLSESGRRGEK